MLQPRVNGFLKTACLTAIIVCSGCAASTATDPIASAYVPAEVQIGSAREVVSEGRIDTANRYMSTVMVTTAFSVPKQGTKVKTCSGVLIEAHAVLTAGHCVCDVRRPVPPEASDAAVTDPSTCAKTANITLLRYQSSETGQAMPGDGSPVPPAVNIGPYRGTVQVHEDLRILYKELETGTGWEMNTEYSNADIAVIILEESLQGYAQPIKLSEEPVRIKERILLVGYGAELFGQAFEAPVRRYGENAVVSIKEDGSTFHIGTQLEIAPSYRGEKPRVNRVRGSYAITGDSGGPCFRERRDALELVGIARSTHGPPIVLSVYTSTHAYLGWLRRQIASAGRTD